MNLYSKILVFVLLLCSLSVHAQRKTKKYKDCNGNRVLCIEEGAQFLKEKDKKSIEAEIPYLEKTLKGNLSIEKKYLEIQKVPGNQYEADKIEYSLCVAYRNCILSRKEYNELYRILQRERIAVINGGTKESKKEVKPKAQRQNIDNKSQEMRDGRVWLIQNLNVKVESSYCYDCNEYGRLYTWEAASKACKELGSEWRLPTDTEWANLTRSYGGYFDNERKEKRGKSPVDAFDILMNGSFNAKLGGARKQNNEFEDAKKQGNYWTSSKDASGKPTSYTFNLYNQMIFRHTARNLESARSVRCIKTR